MVVCKQTLIYIPVWSPAALEALGTHRLEQERKDLNQK